MNNDPTAEKILVDVAKPGQSPAQATSRPVITGHGSIVQDPMVKRSVKMSEVASRSQQGPVVEITERPSVTPTEVSQLQREGRVLAPLSDAEKAAVTASEPATEQAAQEDSAPNTDIETKNETLGSIDSNETAVIDAVASQADKKKQDKLISEQEKAHKEMVEKLVAEKKYFVPIHESLRHKKSSHILMILVPALLITLITGYLLIDAGYISLNITLPVDFIK